MAADSLHRMFNLIVGHSANMNQTTGGSKLFFYVERKPRSEVTHKQRQRMRGRKRTLEREREVNCIKLNWHQTEIGITDIKVIRPRKGEQADAGYSLLLKYVVPILSCVASFASLIDFSFIRVSTEI